MTADNARTVLHFEGWFRSTADITYYTDASFLSQCDRRVPVLVELLCDTEPRMNCVPARPIWLKIKFSLENQPWILTMANWPVLVSSNSNDRSTKHFVQDAELCCQYLLSHSEAMHAFMFSVSSRAIPHSLYSMNAYSTQSFRMTNEKENRTTFCRFHFTAVPNENPLKSQLITNDVSCQSVDDLSQQAVDEIAKGNFLTWRVDIQIFTAAEVAYLPFDAFDSTKVWPHKLSPLVPVGKVVLNKVVHHSTEFTGSNSTIGCMPVCKAASTTEELELTDTDDNGRILTDDACSKKLLTADECQTMDPFWQPGILWRTIFDENERDQVATRIAQYIRPISSPIMTSVLDLFAQHSAYLFFFFFVFFIRSRTSASLDIEIEIHCKDVEKKRYYCNVILLQIELVNLKLNQYERYVLERRLVDVVPVLTNVCLFCCCCFSGGSGNRSLKNTRHQQQKST